MKKKNNAISGAVINGKRVMVNGHTKLYVIAVLLLLAHITHHTYIYVYPRNFILGISLFLFSLVRNETRKLSKL